VTKDRILHALRPDHLRAQGAASPGEGAGVSTPEAEPEFPELESRLRQYKAQTDKLTVEFVDPFKHPGRVKEMNISQSGPRINR